MEKIRQLLKALGPGILIACAAVGGSHLVWSTRAGAEYGWSLLGLVLLANFLKFPFFYFGQHYTAVTGESLLSGYKRQGSIYLYAFVFINLLTGSINVAAVGMLTASLSMPFLGFLNLELTHLTIFIFLILSGILFLGKYAILDRLSKWIILILTFCTLLAVCLAFFNQSPVIETTTSTGINPFKLASLAFIVGLLGWMPAPIDVSTWSSLWMHSREEQTQHKATPKEVTIDFSIGYSITTLLACLFLALGALTVFGTGNEIPQSGIQFSNHLIQLYTSSIGPYAKPIIILVAFFTMLSTTLACLDGYPRSLATSLILLKNSSNKITTIQNKHYLVTLVLYTITASLILLFFVKNLMSFLSFAATVAFLFSPILAWINLKVMTGSNVPLEHQPRFWIKLICYVGIAFFTLISCLFIYQQFID
ncbi:MAG: divalent metal cation transporter [Opitutae bacterium]|nr:divalent metal cation transporter [Opitutae bacterium]